MTEQENDSKNKTFNISDETAQVLAEILVAFLDEKSMTCGGHGVETELQTSNNKHERRN